MVVNITINTSIGNWLKAEIPAMAKIVKDERITEE